MERYNPKFSELLPFYQKEMSYLLESGRSFAQAYPRVAKNLQFDGNGSQDPHVERLLQSFAFLTSRLQMDIEEQPAFISNTLLEVLYPDFARPFPSAAIVQFLPGENAEPAMRQVKARSLLSCVSEEGLVCNFQTTTPVDVWPISVREVCYVPVHSYSMPKAKLKSPWLLKFSLRSHGAPLREMPVEQLRFYLGGNTLTAMTILRWLQTYDPFEGVPVLYEDPICPGRLKLVDRESLHFKGLEAEEGLLEDVPEIGRSYRLLWDFFQFPQKFWFFELLQLKKVFTSIEGEEISFFLPLSAEANPDKWPVQLENIALGCAPVLNLFPKTCEPIHLDYQKVWYRLVPDHRLEQTTEIHSLVKISSASDVREAGEEITPYFSYRHIDKEQNRSVFWFHRRQRTVLESARGQDIFLSFVDRERNLSSLSEKTVYAHALCTNRSLAEKVPAGTALTLQNSSLFLPAHLLSAPTPGLTPPKTQLKQFDVIRHLSIDHLGISGDLKSLGPLKGLLTLYHKSEPSLGFVIEALRTVNIRRSMTPYPGQAFKALVPLVSIDITVDEKAANAQGVFLLLSIVNHLFLANASFNTLIETNVFGMSGALLKTWGPEECSGKSL